MYRVTHVCTNCTDVIVDFKYWKYRTTDGERHYITYTVPSIDDGTLYAGFVEEVNRLRKRPDVIVEESDLDLSKLDYWNQLVFSVPLDQDHEPPYREPRYIYMDY